MSVIKKHDFSLRHPLRVYRGYVRSKKLIESRKIGSEFSYRTYWSNDDFMGYSGREVILPISEKNLRRLEPYILKLEDKNFYKHSGQDWRAFIRAAIHNFREGKIVEGGSTITMQLVRNTLIEADSSFARKLVEILLSRHIERSFTKNDILQMYCEQVYMGRRLRGFESASIFIYRKKLHKLSDLELCGLIGLLRSPRAFNPYSINYSKRQRFISNLFLNSDSSSKAPNPVNSKSICSQRFTEHIKVDRTRIFGVSNAWPQSVGITIDKKYQKHVDNILRGQSSLYSCPLSAIILCNKSSRILVDSTWDNGQQIDFSPSLQGRIQPASTFKIFALISALEQGFPLQLPLMSAPFTSMHFCNSTGKPWHVRNYNDVYRGIIPLIYAFATSDNCAFANLAEILDIQKLYSTYRKFGLLDETTPYPSIVIGTIQKGISPLKLALAYQSIANFGQIFDHASIVRYMKFQDTTIAWSRSQKCCPIPDISYQVFSDSRKALRFAATSYGLPGLLAKTGTSAHAQILASCSDKLTVLLMKWRSHFQNPNPHISKSTPTLIGLIKKFLL